METAKNVKFYPSVKLLNQYIFHLCHRGDSYMKGAGMLVVSIRGVNFGFWSHLGCSGQNATIFNHKGLFKGCLRRKIKNYTFAFFLFTPFM